MVDQFGDHGGGTQVLQKRHPGEAEHSPHLLPWAALFTAQHSTAQHSMMTAVLCPLTGCVLSLPTRAMQAFAVDISVAGRGMCSRADSAGNVYVLAGSGQEADAQVFKVTRTGETERSVLV